MSRPDARAAAFYALMLCRRNGAWPDEAVGQAVRSLDAREAALCRRLTYTVLQNRELLDASIAKHCDRPLKRLNPAVLDALRLGVCQFKLLDKIPAAAAIHETVELLRRRVGEHAVGLCNAVLRAIDRDTAPLAPEGDGPEALALRHSHPEWLVRRFLTLYGAEGTERLLALNNTPPPLTVHLNPLRTDARTLTAAFEKLGGAAEAVPGVADCLRVSGIGEIAAAEPWKRGHFIIADAAARLVAACLNPRPGEVILDCCAAPGGKSFLMAFLSGGQAAIHATDIHPHKVKLLEAGVRRLGLEGTVAVALGDATGSASRSVLAEEGGVRPFAGYDAVLCDVPCSGFGVIRKRPDIRYKTEAEIAGLPALQLSILQAQSGAVKRGGRLVYATCTLLPEENEQVVAAFLATAPDWTLEEEHTLFPPDSGTDGFYYARLRRGEAHAEL